MLPNISSILYASDQGDNSRQVFAYAVALAKTYKVKITFLHVIEPLGHTGKALVRNIVPKEKLEKLQRQGYASIREQIESRITKFCEKECGSKKSRKKIISDVLVVDGYPDEVIIQQAEQMDASLVVMGMHSRSSLERVLIGSVARKVSSNIKRPLLLIPITENH